MARVKRDYKAEFGKQLLEAKLPVRPEYRFSRSRLWQFDWAIPELFIAIEYEGGAFGRKGSKRCPVCKEMPKGAHFMIERIKSDVEKYNEAAALGWCLIRVVASTVDNGEGLAHVKKAIMLRRAAGDAFLPVRKADMTEDLILRVIPSTEPATFNEFVRGLEGDAPECRDEWREMFRHLKKLESDGLVEVDRSSDDKINTLILTDAGVARVKGAGR